MAMNYHLLVGSSSPSRAQDGRPLQRPEQELGYWQPVIFMYRDEHGVWDGVRWNGKTASFLAIRETDEGKAMEKLLAIRPDVEKGG